MPMPPTWPIPAGSFSAAARFGLEATLFQYYEFRFLPDFGQGQTRIQDGYLNIHWWDAFQITSGKFKQPFSYEQLIQDRFTPFMERSLIDQLVPQRDLGLMFHGQNLFQGVLDYGLSVSNGEQNGDADTNESKDVNGRVAIRPFARWEENPLRRLQFGMSGGWGIENEPANPNLLRTPVGVQFFKFNSNVRADGVRSRLSPELGVLPRAVRCRRAVFPHGTEVPTWHGRCRSRAVRWLLRHDDIPGYR